MLYLITRQACLGFIYRRAGSCSSPSSPRLAISEQRDQRGTIPGQYELRLRPGFQSGSTFGQTGIKDQLESQIEQDW